MPQLRTYRYDWPLPDLLTRKNRHCYYYESGGEYGVLVVTGGKETAVYAIEWQRPDPCAPERLTALVAKLSDDSGEIYCTRGDGGSCGCWGFRRWGKCLHVQSLKLVADKLTDCDLENF